VLGESAVGDCAGTALAVIWTSAMLTALWAPDLVTSEAQHRHLPYGWMSTWLWAFTGSFYVLMVPRRAWWVRSTVAIVAIWSMTLAVAVLTPVTAVGVTPILVPLGLIFAPPLGAVTTALVTFQCRSMAEEPRGESRAVHASQRDQDVVPCRPDRIRRSMVAHRRTGAVTHNAAAVSLPVGRECGWSRSGAIHIVSLPFHVG